MNFYQETFQTKTLVLKKCLYLIFSSVFNFYTKKFDDYIQISHKKENIKWQEKKAIMACKYMEKVMKALNIKSCLIKSVSYKTLLNSIGWEADLIIGVENKVDFYSHAWVESSIINLGKPTTQMKIIRKVH